MKLWNGSSWIVPPFKYPKIWNGSSWVYAIPRYYSAAQTTDLKLISVGYQNNDVLGDQFFPGWTDRTYGYLPGYGAISNQGSALYTGAWDGFKITQISYNYSGLTDTWYVTLTIENAPDSGWTNMNINGTIFARGAGGYNSGTWLWSGSGQGVNPFGYNVGANIQVTWS